MKRETDMFLDSVFREDHSVLDLLSDQQTSMDLIRALLDRGANVNAQLKGSAAIEKAAQDMGDKTLAAGATAFMRAARSADVEVMKMLLARAPIRNSPIRTASPR